MRLTEKSFQLGLANVERLTAVHTKIKQVSGIKKVLGELSVEPDEINSFLETISSSPINEKQKAEKILLRPSVELTDLLTHVSETSRRNL